MAAASAVMARTFVLSITLLLLQLCAVWTTAQQQPCNYVASCSNASLSTSSGRPLLTASCPNCNGVVLTTAAIDLNQRVQNNNGSLQCASTGGSFALSCSNLALSGSTLSASCRQSSGGSFAASINLNHCIGNINGNLIWCVGSGPCGGMGSPAMALANGTLIASTGTREANLTGTREANLSASTGTREANLSASTATA